MNDKTDLYGQLVTAGADEASPGDALRQRVLEASLEALSVGEGAAGAIGASGPSPRVIGRVFYVRAIRYAAVAAAVAFVVFGGLSIWPSRSDKGATAEAWWLGPPAAVAAEIQAAIDAIKGVTCRERIILVYADGSEHASSTWDVYYVSQDSYRRDIFDGEQLREIQWYCPDGGNMTQTSVRYDTKSFHAETHKGGFGVYDPVERMRFLVQFLDKADRRLDPADMDGRQCVGFEIRASRYGDNPETWFDRIWFDAETRLPVRMEEHGRPVTDHPDRTFTIVKDQFNWNPSLAADTFVPKIPEGFVNAHPDELGKDQ